MKRYAASLLMLGNAVLAFVTTSSETARDETFTVAAVYAAVLGFLALLLLIWPTGIVAIAGRGVAIAIIVVASGVALLLAIAMFIQEYDTPAPTREIALVSVFIAIQILLLGVLPLEEEERGRGLVLSGIAAVIAIGAFFQLFYLTEAAQIGARAARLRPRLHADSLMKASIARVQACAVVSARRNGVYPAHLASMGPPPAGDGCLDSAHASGQVGEVRLSYAGGSPDTAGRMATFQVVARANAGLEASEPQVAFGDESGILRAGDSTGTPAKLGIVHGGMLALRSVRACAEYYRDRESPDSTYPRSANELFPRHPAKETEENLRWLGCFPTIFPTFDTASLMWNVGTYTPAADARDYVLEIRPRVYGVTGVRSIRTTARGPVHSTVENRPATEADPVVPPCAYEVEGGICAPKAGGVRAHVDVVLPDTATIGEPFTVTIVDQRSASERRHPYQYQVMCKYRMYVDREPPATYTSSPTTQCAAEPESKRGSGGPIWVRIWVRDHAGTLTSIDRRIQLVARRRSANAPGI